MNILPVIVAGGAGQRLWPVSRQELPKPFIKVGEGTLLEQTLRRAQLLSDECLLVTNKDHYFLAESMVEELGMKDQVFFLLEPTGRNTGPAVAIATQYAIEKYGSDTLLLIMPADQLIKDEDLFLEAVNDAVELARQNTIVVFGVDPVFPETGFGYIEMMDSKSIRGRVKNFIEKPDKETAEEFLASGRYLWNAGMFCFVSETMESEMLKLSPELWSATQKASLEKESIGNVIRFKQELFEIAPKISLDYSIIEKSDIVSSVRGKFAWSDVGSWDSFGSSMEKNKEGNSIYGVSPDNCIFEGSKNTVVYSESHLEKAVVALGLSNIAIIDLPDALLVADRDQVQKVKTVLDKFDSEFLTNLTKTSSTVQRPWGTYTTLKIENGYQVKRITVDVGQQLSLQYHHKRAEHWVVVQGKANVQVGEKRTNVDFGSHSFIPIGEIHRLKNVGDTTLVLIEVQYGEYLGEDDIVRLQDDYGRT